MRKESEVVRRKRNAIKEKKRIERDKAWRERSTRISRDDRLERNIRERRQREMRCKILNDNEVIRSAVPYYSLLVGESSPYSFPSPICQFISLSISRNIRLPICLFVSMLPCWSCTCLFICLSP